VFRARDCDGWIRKKHYVESENDSLFDLTSPHAKCAQL